MSGRHHHGSHRQGDDDAVVIDRGPRLVLLVALALAAIATVVGGFLVWPEGDKVDDVGGKLTFAADGVVFTDGSVVDIGTPCASDAQPGDGEDAAGGTAGCGKMLVEVTSGEDDGERASVTIPPEVATSSLAADDPVRLLRIPAGDGGPTQFTYFGPERSSALWVLLALFVVVVVVVARWRGVMALVGLTFTALVLLVFMLPALVTGEAATTVVLVAGGAIIFVVLYTTHGVSMRTSAAVAGTLAGTVLTAGLGAFAVASTHLTGIAGEEGSILLNVVGGLDFASIMTAAIVLAGLGVLNDVTITQASAVWELRAAGPEATRREIFTGAMRIGRDHIASTIYTIVFVYAGSALGVLMLLQLYGLPLADLLATEEIGQEVVRTLASSIALVLSVPMTTAIAAATVPGPRNPVDPLDPLDLRGAPA